MHNVSADVHCGRVARARRPGSGAGGGGRARYPEPDRRARDRVAARGGPALARVQRDARFGRPEPADRRIGVAASEPDRAAGRLCRPRRLRAGQRDQASVDRNRGAQRQADPVGWRAAHPLHGRGRQADRSRRYRARHLRARAQQRHRQARLRQGPRKRGDRRARGQLSRRLDVPRYRTASARLARPRAARRSRPIRSPPATSTSPPARSSM